MHVTASAVAVVEMKYRCWVSRTRGNF